MRPLGERAADLHKRRAWGTLPSGGDRRRPTSTDRFTGVSPELAAASKPSKLHSLAHRFPVGAASQPFALTPGKTETNNNGTARTTGCLSVQRILMFVRASGPRCRMCCTTSVYNYRIWVELGLGVTSVSHVGTYESGFGWSRLDGRCRSAAPWWFHADVSGCLATYL